MTDAGRGGESPDVIYLGPGEPGLEGRLWCQDPVWGDESVAYVRSDLVEDLSVRVADAFAEPSDD